MKKDLPIYNIVMDEETQGLNYVSFVADPAIMEMGLAFSNKPQASFKFNKDKQVVVGPAMIADLPLYREIDGEAFYVVFSKETIEKLVEKFNKDTTNYKINVDHADVVESAFIKSNWIKEDMNYDKSLMYGFNNIPVGSWFVEVKVDDSDFWENEIKSGGKFGFSVEGIFGIDYQNFNKKEKENIMEIKDLTPEEIEMINKFRNKMDFGVLKTKDGEDFYYDGDLLEVDKNVFKDEAMTIAVEDGDYQMEDGSNVLIEGGMVKNISQPSADQPAEVEVEADKVEAIKAAIDPALDSEAILAIVQPKLDELVAMIAEIKSKIEEAQIAEDSSEPIMASEFERKTSAIKAFRSKFNR